MIVWLASYPRSGNTFLRIALHQMFGVTSSVVYDFDGVASRVGKELVGHVDRAPLTELRASPEVHFVKMHRPYDSDVETGDRAICLVRDGRDAAVSWARLMTERQPTMYEAVLAELVDRPERRGSGSWGAHVLSWLDAPLDADRTIILFEELTEHATRVVTSVMDRLGLAQSRRFVATLPTFDDLQKSDPLFFRRGRVGTHRDEMPIEIRTRFDNRTDNATALRRVSSLRSCA